MAKRANVALYAGFIKNGDALHTQYKAYEAQYVHRAHEELYALLAEILKFVQSVFNEADSAEIIKAIRRQLKDEYGIKTNTKTGDIGVLLRLVLRGAHRKTLFTYKHVLQQAINNNVVAEDLAEYIKENGGIEKLRTGEAEKAAANEQTQLSKAKKRMASYYLIACGERAKIASVDLDIKKHCRLWDASNKDGFVFVACSYNNGKLNLLDFVDVDDELNEKLLVKVFADTFASKGLFGERKMLAKRAIELEQLEASMFAGKIYSGGKAIDEETLEEIIS